MVSVLVAECLLIASTWRLWLGGHDFPVAPLIRALSGVPLVVDRLLTLLFCAAILTWLSSLLLPTVARNSFSERWRSLAAWCALSCAIALSMLNQHRLQPWHWLFILLSAQVLLIESRHQTMLRRLTIASIYVFAGLSRLGPDLSSGASRQLVTIACQKLNAVGLLHNESAIVRTCIVMVVTEIVTGIALLIPFTRKPAIAVAVTMHVILILLLSPLGLNHHFGVLIWNAFFVVSVPLLFRSQNTAAQRQRRPLVHENTSGISGRTVAFATFVLLFPVSGLFGIADNWPSWQVYSPRPDLARLYVRSRSVASLPPAAQPFVGRPAPLDDWCPVRIDRWSLNVVKAPLYPEDRFQLAVTLQICRDVPETDVQVRMQSARPLYWQGHRVENLSNLEAIRRRAAEHILNGINCRH